MPLPASSSNRVQPMPSDHPIYFYVPAPPTAWPSTAWPAVPAPPAQPSQIQRAPTQARPLPHRLPPLPQAATHTRAPRLPTLAWPAPTQARSTSVPQTAVPQTAVPQTGPRTATTTSARATTTIDQLPDDVLRVVFGHLAKPQKDSWRFEQISSACAILNARQVSQAFRRTAIQSLLDTLANIGYCNGLSTCSQFKTTFRVRGDMDERTADLNRVFRWLSALSRCEQLLKEQEGLALESSSVCDDVFNMVDHVVAEAGRVVPELQSMLARKKLTIRAPCNLHEAQAALSQLRVPLLHYKNRLAFTTRAVLNAQKALRKNLKAAFTLAEFQQHVFAAAGFLSRIRDFVERLGTDCADLRSTSVSIMVKGVGVRLTLSRVTAFVPDQPNQLDIEVTDSHMAACKDLFTGGSGGPLGKHAWQNSLAEALLERTKPSIVFEMSPFCGLPTMFAHRAMPTRRAMHTRRVRMSDIV